MIHTHVAWGESNATLTHDHERGDVPHRHYLTDAFCHHLFEPPDEGEPV